MRGQPTAAAVARAARDLERHDDPIADTHGDDGVADVDDFGDELVAEADLAGHREAAGGHGAVDIAEGNGERAHERFTRTVEFGNGAFRPGQPARLDAGELRHAASTVGVWHAWFSFRCRKPRGG